MIDGSVALSGQTTLLYFIPFRKFLFYCSSKTDKANESNSTYYVKIAKL